MTIAQDHGHKDEEAVGHLSLSVNKKGDPVAGYLNTYPNLILPLYVSNLWHVNYYNYFKSLYFPISINIPSSIHTNL